MKEAAKEGKELSDNKQAPKEVDEHLNRESGFSKNLFEVVPKSLV